jgi:hypothetical protein
MGVPTLEVGYTSATTGRGDHEVHKGHVMALEIHICNKQALPKVRQIVACLSTCISAFKLKPYVGFVENKVVLGHVLHL